MDGTRIAPVSIRRAAAAEEFVHAGALAAALWPNHTAQEMAEELSTADAAKNAVFLAFMNEEPAGFAHASLRVDYVEGTNSSPVGYLEGIYVCPPYRMQGIAKGLVDACGAWARERGCTQFASDCEIENVMSARMHAALGFKEANRIVCFTKEI